MRKIIFAHVHSNPPYFYLIKLTINHNLISNISQAHKTKTAITKINQ